MTTPNKKSNKPELHNRCFLTRLDKQLYMARLKWMYLTQVKHQCEVVQSQYNEAVRAIGCQSLNDADASRVRVHARNAFSPERESNQKLWNLIKKKHDTFVPKECIEAIQKIMQRAQKLAVDTRCVQEEINRMFELYNRLEYEAFYNAKYEHKTSTIIKWNDLQWLTLVTEFALAWIEVCVYSNTLQVYPDTPEKKEDRDYPDVLEKKGPFLRDCAKLLFDKNVNETNELKTLDDKNNKIIELCDEALFNKLTAMGNYLNVNFTEGMKQICTDNLLNDLKNEPVKEENTVNEIGKGIEYKHMNNLYQAISKAQHPPRFDTQLNPIGYYMLTQAMCLPDEGAFQSCLYECDWCLVEAADVIRLGSHKEIFIEEWNDDEEEIY